MRFIHIGEYLDRKVKILKIKESSDIKRFSLNDSVLLLFFSVKLLSKKELNNTLEKIISLNPLAIEVAGYNASKAFDLLLKKLSNRTTPHHIMTSVTNSTNIPTILDDLLFATWPTEESFDVWKNYSIIFLGKNNEYIRFEKEVKKFFKNHQ